MGFSTIGTSNKSELPKAPSFTSSKIVEGIIGPGTTTCGSTVTFYRSTTCPCSTQPWQEVSGLWATQIAGGGSASYLTVEVNSCDDCDPNCEDCETPVGSFGVELGDCGCDLAVTVYPNPI